MQFIMIVFIKKRCLHFVNLNVHLVSHRILINFVSTQQPEIFCKSQSVYQQINYVLHANRYASIAKRIIRLLSCLIRLQNHVTFTLLVMVGPGKLMIGQRPQWAWVWLHHCVFLYINLSIITVTNGKHGFLVIYVWRNTHLKAYVWRSMFCLMCSRIICKIT